MAKPRTRRDYCSGCGRWIYTWKQNPWSDHSWSALEARPCFGKFCDHGKWCQDCWGQHRTTHEKVGAR